MSTPLEKGHWWQNIKNQLPTGIELTINVVLHVLILFTILTALFWIFISEIETTAIDYQIKTAIDAIFSSYVSGLSSQQAQEVGAVITANMPELVVLKNEYSNPDPATQLNNQWLLDLNVTILLAIVGILVTILLILPFVCSIKTPFWHILLENIILFSCIGLIEGIFFYYIALKFVPVMPSVLGNTAIQSLKQNL